MEAAFRAISDPSRRAVLDLLSAGERTVSELLQHFSFSQPALSKHLRVLRQAKLVTTRSDGRQRRYALRAEGLRTVADWLRYYEKFWDRKLDALGAALDRQASAKKKAR